MVDDMAAMPALAIYDAASVRAALPFPALIEALREAFRRGAEVPLRHRHDFGDGASLLLMPAWSGRQALGVKIVGVVAGNGARGLPAVSSTYLLCDAETGQHLAVMDGGELTARRTAAASALAGDYLARADAATLLLVGSGHVAQRLAPAWASVRPIRRVLVWNRRADGAAALVGALRRDGFAAEARDDLAPAVAEADIVSCATLATEPLVRGAWLRPGAHVDLIGGYLPTMREADDAAVRRARVFIDSDAALEEAGDITQPLASGALGRVEGTLAMLCRGDIAGRADGDEITLFKSVGTALEDLAAAALVHRPGG
jgi:ornithine cyclodeaminase